MSLSPVSLRHHQVKTRAADFGDRAIAMPPVLRNKYKGPLVVCLFSGWIRKKMGKPHELFRLFRETDFYKLWQRYDGGKRFFSPHREIMLLVFSSTYNVTPSNGELHLSQPILSAMRRLGLADWSATTVNELVLVEGKDHIQVWQKEDWLKSTALRSEPR